MRPARYALAAALLLAAAIPRAGAAAQETMSPAAPVAGRVTDRWGAPVERASVELSGGGGAAARAVTGVDGRFAFERVAPGRALLTAAADGFGTAERELDVGAGGVTGLEVALDPAPFSEEVTVTPSRVEARTGETAASVVVLSERDLAATAAASLDGALRQVPGFSLFRRTDSRVANPTTQGASLRGVAPSGASRVVVLADGIPLNDPFGGWVYWSRVARASVRRVEAARGGGSSLYGTDALGGVVNVLTAGGDAPRLDLEASGGSQGTALVSLAGSYGAGPWSGTLAVEGFRTDGYVLVDDSERGPVDTAAASEHATVDLALERRFAAGRAFARGSLFSEERENGTPLQTNATAIRQLAAGADYRTERLGSFALRLYAGAQLYDQTFSAVSADRTAESLTRSQRVPAQQAGLSLVWSGAAGSRVSLVAGGDAREVRGTSEETGYFGGRATSALEAGGRQRSGGIFGEGTVRLAPDLFVALGARFDRWRNYEGRSLSYPLAVPAAVRVDEFPDRTESAFSPRASLVYRASPAVSLRAAAYRAFRAPTLNELYRGFRVGDVVTLANDRLRAERLTGGEAGVTAALFDGRASLRGTFYWSEVTRPVANATLEVTPDLITRRRENLGRVRARGVELDVDARLPRGVVVTGGYVYADSTVLRFEANPAIEGRNIPQVPRHQAAVQALVPVGTAVSVGLQARFVGAQFDDDRNELRLEPFATVDVLVSRPVARGLELFAAVENAFGTRYEVGRTPVTTVGPPASIRAGVRFRSR